MHIFSTYGMEPSAMDRDKISDRLVPGLNDDGEEVPNGDLAIE